MKTITQTLLSWQKFKIAFLLALLTTAAPLLRAQTIESHTFTTNRLVPDGNASGLSDMRHVTSAIETITALSVRLKITGEFNGDVYCYLRHSSGFAVLLNRPGLTAANNFGYANSGFDVTFQTDATNSDVHVYQNVMTPAAGFPLTGCWQPDGRNVDPATVTDASFRTTSLTNFNNLNAMGSWTLYLVDAASGGTNMLTEWGLDIAGVARPALTWLNPADIVYGAALDGSQLNAMATYNTTNVPGTFSYSPAAGTILTAGPGQTLSLTFTPTDTNSFMPVTASVTINVALAPLTITAVSASQVYGADLPVLTASYDGFVNGDTAANLSPDATLGASALASSPVGVYTLMASGAASTNYSITEINGTLTITPSLSTGLLVSSANPSLPGNNVTFTMSLGAAAPGAGVPSGTVNFIVDGGAAASVTLSYGVAALTMNNLALGSHSVAAEYSGDLNFAGTTNVLAQPQVIATPLVAGGFTLQRYPTQGVKVLVATLLACDSNPDGGTLNLVVSSSSANGATISEADGWVCYTPAIGFTNADSFTYTITNGYGVSAVGTVTVAILADTSPAQNLTIKDLGNGSFLITGNGIPTYTYRLQYSPTLVTPAWQDIAGGSVTADSQGQFTYTGTSGSQAAFYRTVYP